VTVPVVGDATARQRLDLVIVATGLEWAVRGDGVELGAPGESSGP